MILAGEVASAPGVNLDHGSGVGDLNEVALTCSENVRKVYVVVCETVASVGVKCSRYYLWLVKTKAKDVEFARVDGERLVTACA